MHVPLMSDAHSVQTSVGCVHRNGEPNWKYSFEKKFCDKTNLQCLLVWYWSLWCLHRAYLMIQFTSQSLQKGAEYMMKQQGLTWWYSWSKWSLLPIEYDSYVPGSAHVCSQEFMLCESYSGIVMVVLCYVPSRICDGHCSISCNWKIFTSTDPLSSMSAL
jgi:hypothetical protein